MNRNEAVQKLSKVARISMSYAEDLYDSFFEKPVVPQYVADWYEKNKDSFNFYLVEVINNIPYGADEEDFSDFEKWIDDEDDSLTILVNMHQFGYEVEDEPKYTVRIKGIYGYSKYLNRDTSTQKWLFASKTELERFRAHHTRKELEANGFGWVFNCEGVEVKEVE